MSNISMEFQEITLEVQNSKETVQSVVVLMDEVSKSFSALCDVFLVICHELNLGKHQSKKVAIALGVSLGFASLILLSLCLFWYRKKRQQGALLYISDYQEDVLVRLGNLSIFTFRQLQHATDNFSFKNILGAGGFGNVYRGKLGDGTLVAVKRLKDVTGSVGESQFRTELEIISLALLIKSF